MDSPETQQMKEQTKSRQQNFRKPIEKHIFERMIFCDEIFKFMDLEETMFLTSLDVDLNSFSKKD